MTVTICCISPYPCDAVPGHVTARDNSRKVSSDHIRYKDLCHTLLMILIIVTPDSTYAPYHAYAFYSFSIPYYTYLLKNLSFLAKAIGTVMPKNNNYNDQKYDNCL